MLITNILRNACQILLFVGLHLWSRIVCSAHLHSLLSGKNANLSCDKSCDKMVIIIHQKHLLS